MPARSIRLPPKKRRMHKSAGVAKNKAMKGERMMRGAEASYLIAHYTLAELRDYCRAHGIHLGGRKRDLAGKIVNFHADSEDRGYMSKARRQRRTRSAVLRRSRRGVPFRRRM